LASPVFKQLIEAFERVPKPSKHSHTESQIKAEFEKQSAQISSFAQIAAATPTNQNAQPKGKTVYMSEQAREMVYKGIDPRKKRMTEIYVGGLRRTYKSLIRQALRADGIPTSNVVDLQFIGKNVTMLLVPVELADTVLTPLKLVKHFKVIDNFDPLDTTHMKTLPQYQGKTEDELRTIARAQATKRIQKYIDKLPESRAGTRKYYSIQLHKLEETGNQREKGEATRKPKDITAADFFTNALEDMDTQPAEPHTAESRAN
jgi:hypothetical protein